MLIFGLFHIRALLITDFPTYFPLTQFYSIMVISFKYVRALSFLPQMRLTVTQFSPIT